ncbi:P-loop containing nucleoside triphosphate hydrolase protein [Pseudoneurospora amorphoporcata]|uniref:P-loop containing nucleoside triphosphate hydrolase protein n=1 Tax=Pseudoneurospora amorphoporcata TaxID=241081 RepID=A0AAN6NK31_9PEZI|nr:P-loop containing nucleoside triphosphate hydrolase protein [Pseudoneurospora amorphoporcata]
MAEQALQPSAREQRAAYNRWKKSLECRKESKLGSDNLQQIWTEGYNLLETGSGELHARLLADLVDEKTGGPFIIRRTILTSAGHNDWAHRLALYEALLKVVTHSSLVNHPTASNDHLALLYTIIGEEDGAQGIRWLTKLTGLFDRKQRFVQIRSLVHLTAKALEQLLDQYPPLKYDNRSSALRNVLNTFSGASAPHVAKKTHNTNRPATHGTAAAIGNIHADHAPQLPHRTKQPQLVLPSPGAIPGGRHDNDFSAISDIQILPTYGEIMSQRMEYLPTTDLTQESFHKDIRKRYIDTLFRLYRHNTFSAVKDFLREQLADNPTENLTNTSHSELGRNGLAHFYAAATIQMVDVSLDKGIMCTISFLQLPHLRKLSQADQARWWVNSSRLEPGKLLAMVVSSNEGRRRLLYLVVGDEYIERHQSNKFKEMISGMRPRVQVKLARETELDIDLLNKLHVTQAQGHLFELCGLIPQAYEPTLTNIQRMSNDNSLVFQKWIIPTAKTSQQDRTVPPPKYARKQGFVYKLDCITKEKQPNGLKLNPNKSPKGDDLIALQKATGLNASQAQALVAALSQEFVQIQGPPGTGKTYVGLQIVKVLVEHKTTCKLSPIFIVCETNHALDQFGEHIVEAGIDNVVRVGSRSKSKLLEKHNFSLMRRKKTTKGEKRARSMVSAQIQGALSMARRCLGLIHQAMAGRPAWPLLKTFLSSKYPRIYRQLQPDDAEGFTLVGDPILNWLGQRPSKTNHPHYARLIGKADTNILSLTVNEKWALVLHWLDRLVKDQTKSMMGYLQKAQRLRQDLERINQEINCRILRNVDIVLMTTSRLAHDNEMLRKLKPKVIICEEAAEVMEPRMMAVFIPGVEHLIQIGDHQQLRPLVQNSMQFSMESKVGKHYQLDRSLFERRVTGEPGMKPLPVIQLNEQQRMPPEISALIRNNVYKDLKDGSRVMDRPMVVGLRERLYWWDHEHEEGTGLNAAQSMSYINSVEVAMTTALVRHLVRQGVYKGKDIAILTPYAGQLLKLQAALDEHFEVVLSERDEERLAAQGLDKENKITDSEIQTQTLLPSGKMQMAEPIRLATVDGFQGEQAKVIIISLVRSNKKTKVGFLKLKNRINVLLSRVQHGMYLIGNAATFPAVDMWKDVYRQICARKAAGPSIPLCCPRHPNTPIYCTSPEDFASVSPEGGCTLDCADRLPVCGHPCPNKCHSEMLHKAVICPKPCPRVRKTCKHACPRVCGEECGNCMVIVNGIELPCGHTKDNLLCFRLLKVESVLCRVKVDKQVPACGHTVTVDCCTDVSSDGFLCEGRCDALLPCKHKCQGTCWLCRRYDEEKRVTVEHKACEICKPDTWGLGDIERKLAFVDGQLRQSSDIADADTAKQLFLGRKLEGGDEDKTPDRSLPQDRYESCQKLLALCQQTQERIMAHDSLTTAMDGLSLDRGSQSQAQADAQNPRASTVQLDLLAAKLVEHKVQEAVLRDKFRLSVKLDEESEVGTTADADLQRSVDSFQQTGTTLLNDCDKAKVPRLTFIATVLCARVDLMHLLYDHCLRPNDELTERLKGIFEIFVKAQQFCDESSKEDADLRRCLHEVFRFKKRPADKLTLKEVVEVIGEAPVVLRV